MIKNDKCVTCNGNGAESNNNYLPEPCTGCEEFISTTCVIYDGPDTECIKIPNGANLTEIIKGLDEIICLLAEGGDYSDYDFSCLNYLNIKSEQQFVELISDIICQILGDMRPGNIISLTQIIDMINNALHPKFTFPDCAEPLVNLPPDSSLEVVITALRSAICLHKDRLDNLAQAVDSLTNRVNIIEGDIVNIKSTLANHEQRITILEARPIPNNTDELVKVSPTDTTAGYLISKIDTAGSNVIVTQVNPGSNEKIALNVNIPPYTDEKVKVWSGDTEGFLEGKITSVNAPGINLVTARDGNVIKTTPTLLYDQIAAQVLNLFVTIPGLKDQFCQLVYDCIDIVVPCTPPATLVVTEAGVDYISVQWSVLPGNQTVGYKLEYKLASSPAGWTVIDLPATASTYKITGLNPGTAYNIRIKTDCGVKQSNYTISDPDPAITNCPIPTNLNVTFS